MSARGTTFGYIDDFYSCHAAPDGRAFVTMESLDELEALLEDQAAQCGE